jgi:hypothetical protein
MGPWARSVMGDTLWRPPSRRRDAPERYRLAAGRPRTPDPIPRPAATGAAGSPGRARALLPQDAVDGPPVVGGGSAHLGPLGGSNGASRSHCSFLRSPRFVIRNGTGPDPLRTRLRACFFPLTTPLIPAQHRQTRSHTTALIAHNPRGNRTPPDAKVHVPGN